jgi:hypothetical protein
MQFGLASRESHCGSATRTELFKQLDHCVEVGIACTKLPREPVAASLSNRFAVRDHIELASLTGRKDGIDS